MCCIKRRMAWRIALAGFMLSLLLGASASRAQSVPEQQPTVSRRLERLEQEMGRRHGQSLYHQACAPCHGPRGNGLGPAARGLHIKPHDFTRGVYKFRTTPLGTPPTDADIFRTISEGVPGTRMPAWKRLLSERQRLDLVQYLKTFAAEKFAAMAKTSIEPLQLPPAPPATSASIDQGKAVYERLQCQICHGPGGRGDGPLAANLRDLWNRPIRPQNFAKGVYKSGRARADVLRTILTGLDGTPMPAYSGAISIEEGWALVDYLRSLSKRRTLRNYLFVETGGSFPGH